MSDKKTKSRFLVIALLATLPVGGVALHLFGKPLPSVPLPIPSAQKSSSSTQPKIIWSESRIEVTLSPGESIPKSLTFTSTLAFTNAVIEGVPEIARFFSLQPNTFTNVPANQPQQVAVAFSIPEGTAFGTYEGTVHLKSGSQTLPQTLKIIVNVWGRTAFSSEEVSIALPPAWISEATTNQIAASSPALQELIGLHDAEVPSEELLVRAVSKPGSQPVTAFASAIDGGRLETYAVKLIAIIDGRDAIVYSDVPAVVPHHPILIAVVDDSLRNRALLVSLRQLTPEIPQGLQELFLQILSTIRFQ